MTVGGQPTAPAGAGGPWVEVFASRGFAGWLAGQRAGLAFTAYQAGKRFLLGPGDGGRPAVCERSFGRCTGLWSDGQTLWMAARCPTPGASVAPPPTPVPVPALTR